MNTSIDDRLNPGRYLYVVPEGENGDGVQEKIYWVCVALFPRSKVHKSDFGCVVDDDVVADRQPGELSEALFREGIQHTFGFMTYARGTYRLPEKTKSNRTSDQRGFPRFWELFPIILPRSLRDRVYDPCHEELKEAYLKERTRWRTKCARRWVTFCFTFRTALLVGTCCWAGLSGSARKALIAVVGLVLGERVVSLLRDKLCEWLGRLP